MSDPILKALADNPALFEATKSAVASKFDASFNTSEFTPDTPDEVLGQYLRAKVLGLKLVEEAFKDIAKHKSPSPSQERTNGAR